MVKFVGESDGEEEGESEDGRLQPGRGRGCPHQEDHAGPLPCECH